MTNKSMKRIHKVVVKKMFDESPDTSWLGEYASSPTSEFSIDRAHTLDCPVNTGMTPLDYKTRTAAHALSGARCECADSGCKVHTGRPVCVNGANTILYRVDMDDASGTLMCSECADDATMSGLFTEADDPELQEPQCDCDERGDMERNEYQYFNPSFNYVDGNGHALAENTPDEVRKYVRQDYERMQSLHRGDWSYLGIRADAEYHIDTSHGHSIIQSVTSGGLWGIESDSDAAYIAEVEADELAELRTQLASIGFSKRAISAAFKSVEHVDVG